jgi:hypothetical protein
MSEPARVGEAAPAPATRPVYDALAPTDVQAFFDRWSQRLPWPMTAADRVAGYDHRLAISQLEVSLTDVFDRPVQGRQLLRRAHPRESRPRAALQLEVLALRHGVPLNGRRSPSPAAKCGGKRFCFSSRAGRR